MATNIHACIFTGLPLIHWEPREGSIYHYTIDINGKQRSFRFHENEQIEKWANDTWFSENQYILASVIYNNDWIENEESILTLENLPNLLKEISYPTTPQGKLEYLFLALFKLQNFDGDIINVENELTPIGLNKWRCCFFKSFDEFRYYYFTLVQENLIERIQTPLSKTEIQSCKITYKGLLHAIKIQNEGEQSNKCFVAMSFKEGMEETREIIRAVVKKTKFEPVFIDEVHNNSDVTINDAIIAGLKQCKFCIADFTNQSCGVYFESGFALGQGKKVIYICHDTHSRECHFDTRAFQHIFYKSLDQLSTDLENKINAWIK